MRTPGERCIHLIKIEVTNMNDLRNTPEKYYWTKFH